MDRQHSPGGPLAGAILGSLLLFASTTPVRGHVKYVAPGDEGTTPGDLLGAVAGDPVAVGLLGGGTLAVLLLVGLYLRYRPARFDLAVLRSSLSGYRDLLPWLARLSVGLPLVGAGFAGYFFSPTLTAANPATATAVRLFGITVGFLLVFGLATRLTALVGLLGYLAGLVTDPTLLLAFEYLPGFLAVLVLGGGRPSADHVLGRLADADGTLYRRVDPVHRTLAPIGRRLAGQDELVPVVVRVGIGLAFVYLGTVQKLLTPGDAIAVVGKYGLTGVVPVSPELWVVGAGLVETAVGLALVAGAFTRACSGVAILLFTTTLFALPDDPVLAHVSLFGLVSVLVVTGAGPYSVDRWLADRFGSRDPATRRPGVETTAD